jgi:hypothetical protein
MQMMAVAHVGNADVIEPTRIEPSLLFDGTDCGLGRRYATLKGLGNIASAPGEIGIGATGETPRQLPHALKERRSNSMTSPQLRDQANR